MKRLCVVTAADIEFKTVAALLTDCVVAADGVCRGRCDGRLITLLKTEIGARGFAAKLAAHLTTHRYDALLVAGLCGALDRKLKTGDAVIYDRCFDGRAAAAGEGIGCDALLSDKLLAAVRAAGVNCGRGAGVTVAHIVVAAADKLALGARWDAAAVDMETYDVLAGCAEFDLPAAALRVVMDEAAHDLPDFNRALAADGRMNAGRTAAALAARPLAAARFFTTVRPAQRALQLAVKAVFNVET